MALWPLFDRLAGHLSAGVTAILDKLSGIDDPARRPVVFTIALVALSAKMARADGVVSADEIAAFRRAVEIPDGEAAAIERLFDMARADVAGFESYARQVARIAEGDALFLADVLDGLFGIATADGAVHEAELAYLTRVAEIFGLDEAAFARVSARHVRRRGPDPYALLGLTPAASDDEVKARYRALARDHHPDRALARGLPAEAIALATDRFAAIATAYEAIRAERGLA